MLKRVVVCDSKNRGKVCMREEDMEECRNKRLDKDTNTELHCTVLARCGGCPFWICQCMGTQ